LHFMMGCISILSNSLVMYLNWAVWIFFETVGSYIKSKCCLFTYSLAVFNEFLYESLSSVFLSAFSRFKVYCLRFYSFWAATIALIWVTSPRGLVMKDVSIFGSERMFWLRVIGSLGFLSSI
jgi:hypothetical protein